MEADKRIKTVKPKITFEVDGEQRRLGWLVQNKPEFLLLQLSKGDKYTSAILSELARAGWDRPRIEKEANEHPEWGFNPGILGEI